MSEHTLRFLLQELTRIRVCCQSSECKGKVTVELSLEELRRKYDRPRCPFCAAELDPVVHGRNPLAALARAMQDVVTLQNFVQVEFVLPVEEKRA